MRAGMLRSLGVSALGARALARASSPVLRVSPALDVGAALALMHSERVGALLVAGPAADAEHVGILTERDVLEKIDFDMPVASVLVNQVMTSRDEMIHAHVEDSLDFVLERMQTGGFRHMPVVRDGQAVGMLSMRDIAHAIVQDWTSTSHRAAPAVEVTAVELCRARSRTINLGSLARPSCIEAPPSSSVADAVQLMRQWGAGSVLVPSGGPSVDTSRRACGIFTERDYMRLLGSAAALNQTIDPRRVDLSRCCTAASGLVSATVSTPAIQCLALMSEMRIRHLPVMQEEEIDASFELGESDEPPAAPALLAILSVRDVLAQFLHTQPVTRQDS